MANQPVIALYTTGQNLYSVSISNVTSNFYNTITPGYEVYASGHWIQYATVLTEFSGSGIYRGTYPVASPTQISTEVIFARAGGSPALGDQVLISYQSQGATVGAVAGGYAAAQNLGLTLNGMIPGAVVSGTLTSSAFSTNLTSSVNAAYQGRICLFTSGVLINQVGNIVAYDGTSFLLSVGGPFTTAPSISDTFIII